MITKIKGKHFKNGDFIHDLGQLTLFMGGNGSGKTAIGQAVCLAVNGFIPGIGKTNPAIFAAVAETGSDFVSVEFEAGKTSFLRRYLKSPDGTVSSDLAVNGRKASAQVFADEMGRVGLYAIGDLSSFIGVSDRKKIDAIFDRYPPAPDLVKISVELDEKRKELNAAVAGLKAAEQSLSQFKHQRSGIELPDMTLNECDGKMQGCKRRLLEAEQAELAARDEERGQILPKPVIETRYETKPETMTAPKAEPLPWDDGEALPWENKRDDIPRSAAIDALQAILGAVNKSGCGETCVALMVIKREIRKLKSWGKM